jgi:hypothetical protein
MAEGTERIFTQPTHRHGQTIAVRSFSLQIASDSFGIATPSDFLVAVGRVPRPIKTTLKSTHALVIVRLRCQSTTVVAFIIAIRDPKLRSVVPDKGPMTSESLLGSTREESQLDYHEMKRLAVIARF